MTLATSLRYEKNYIPCSDPNELIDYRNIQNGRQTEKTCACRVRQSGCGDVTRRRGILFNRACQTVNKVLLGSCIYLIRHFLLLCSSD